MKLNNGGLLAWGGHLAYNATDDGFAGNPGGKGRIHELKCFFPHYTLLWEANPRAAQELIENIWNGHVLDWATLDFNRHGNPNQRGKLRASEYRGSDNWLSQSSHAQGPRFQDGFGVFDTPEPRGPWTTVFFTEDWDVGPGETASLPTKWMSADGRTVHLVFSGNDHFSVRQGTLGLQTEPNAFSK